MCIVEISLWDVRATYFVSMTGFLVYHNSVYLLSPSFFGIALRRDELGVVRSPGRTSRWPFPNHCNARVKRNAEGHTAAHQDYSSSRVSLISCVGPIFRLHRPLAIPKSLQRESQEKRRGTNCSSSKLFFLSRFSNPVFRSHKPLAIPKSLQRESQEKRRGTNCSSSKLFFLSRFSNLLRWSGLPIAQAAGHSQIIATRESRETQRDTQQLIKTILPLAFLYSLALVRSSDRTSATGPSAYRLALAAAVKS